MAQTLVVVVGNSVELEGGEAAKLEIWILVNDYIAKKKQMERLDDYLAQKVTEVPNVEKPLTIKRVGLSSVIDFIAEVGNIGSLTDPKQIQKLAVLEITKISSGKKKGYRNRMRNPLGGMQAKIAVACKAIRAFYTILKTGCDFDKARFREGIIRPEAA